MQTLDPDTFAKRVLDKKLAVAGPIRGYLYASDRGTDSEVLYKTLFKAKWLYQARRVATQANAAGGAIKIDIAPVEGQVLILDLANFGNSGNNGINIKVLDEDDATTGILASVGAAAGTYVSVPNHPAAAAASTATATMASSVELLVPYGSKFAFEQSAAGAQNDTATLGVMLVLIGKETEPTWSVSRSVNAGNVTLAASSIGSNVVTPVVE